MLRFGNELGLVVVVRRRICNLRASNLPLSTVLAELVSSFVSLGVVVRENSTEC